MKLLLGHVVQWGCVEVVVSHEPSIPWLQCDDGHLAVRPAAGDTVWSSPPWASLGPWQMGNSSGSSMSARQPPWVIRDSPGSPGGGCGEGTDRVVQGRAGPGHRQCHWLLWGQGAGGDGEIKWERGHTGPNVLR